MTNEGRLESWADCSLCPQLVSVIDRVCFLQDTPNTPKPGSSCSLDKYNFQMNPARSAPVRQDPLPISNKEKRLSKLIEQ